MSWRRPSCCWRARPLAQAQADATVAAERAVRDADARRDQAAVLVASLESAAQVEQAALDSKAPAKVSAARREEFIARARRASHEPLNEMQTRVEIDRQLGAAGWVVQDENQINLYADTGVAVREVTLAAGRADYLYVNQRLVGVIEAKREGTAPRGVEAQLDRYLNGLTAEQKIAAWHRDDPLPFGYVATGTETAFVNRLDLPRTREVFAFIGPRHSRGGCARPTTTGRRRRFGTAAADAGAGPARAAAGPGRRHRRAGTLARRGPAAPADPDGHGRGQDLHRVTASYRLLKHARAARILFLVDRNNLGKQTLREYAGYQTPDDGRKFTELYNVDRLSSAGMLASSNVVISTIQRLYGALRGDELPDVDLDDRAYDDYELDGPAEVAYNRDLPPETFDLIVVDECHRSIYGKWRGVIEYFDAFVVGLTATPVKQTLGFFQQNLVSEYTYEQAVADGVNVSFDVYRIKTEITEKGADIEAGTVVPLRDRRTWPSAIRNWKTISRTAATRSAGR
ncbi:hypothetical protein GCM10027614_25340 [Micromonospora vulcania]